MSKWKVDLPEQKEWKDLYPFHAACQGGDLKAAETFLLSSSSSSVSSSSNPILDVNALDDDGWSGLHYACWYNHDAVVRLLLRQPTIVINVINGSGSTPLHLAAGNGHAGICELLIANGADPNRKDNEKMTPAQLAKQIQPDEWEKVIQVITKASEKGNS